MKPQPLFFAAVLALTSAPQAFGWGQYGHEQINDQAVQVLISERHELAKCFGSNRQLMRRLSITPDMDWKMIGNNSNLTPEQRKLKATADHYEHPLHFFEADAFAKHLPSDIAELPSGEYHEVFEKYRALLSANAAHVVEVDPSKKIVDPAHPTNKEVTDHGTAPWRILQLYDLGVEALKKKNFTQASFYLGAMGHYVGDMSQPFHATLNFDGEYYPTPAAGIHHVFEEAILENAAKAKKISRDPTSGLWPSFVATEDGVKAYAEKIISKKGLDGLQRDAILSEVFGLVASGYPYIGALLKVYSLKCAEAQAQASQRQPGSTTEGRRKRKPKADAIASLLAPDSPSSDHGATHVSQTGAAYCVAVHTPGQRNSKVKVGAWIEHEFSQVTKDGVSVLQLAERRMGGSSALLARIWASAYEAAGKPDLDECGEIKFSESGALEHYPKPEYLPTR